LLLYILRQEKKYLERQVDDLDDMLPSYFRDFWNYFDWTVYFLLFLVTVSFKYLFIRFHAHFSSREGRRGQQP